MARRRQGLPLERTIRMTDAGIAAAPDRQLVQRMLAQIAHDLPRPVRLMEVCGTHTMALFETGLRRPLAEMGIELVSGPGCPVCVTPAADLDFTVALAQLPGITLCTFGDMLRVPGTSASLADAKALGADIRVVYSATDAVEFARNNPQRQVVFLGIGFETTAPGVAFSITCALQLSLENYFVLAAHKLIPPAMDVLAQDPRLKLDGFICPGHVSVITGAAAYARIAETWRKPCVITGFTALDILAGVLAAVRQIRHGTASVENAYRRVVRDTGNPAARALIAEVFEPCNAEWRGLGLLPDSGLALREKYARLDARRLMPAYSPPPPNPALAACRCGDVLKGLIRPASCGNFGTACTPQQPLGTCMVSQEGACRAYYRFRDPGGGA